MPDTKLLYGNDFGEALRAVGELLAADDQRIGIVVIGGGLDVGLAGRLDLICFKLDAAADQPTSNSRHFRDLVALNPSDQEIAIASEWVHEKNVGDEHHTIIDLVVEYVRSVRK